MYYRIFFPLILYCTLYSVQCDYTVGQEFEFSGDSVFITFIYKKKLYIADPYKNARGNETSHSGHQNNEKENQLCCIYRCTLVCYSIP